MKYRPDYPDRFDSIEQAQAWARTFVTWYNFEHFHSGIGFVPPAALHFGQAQQIVDQRQSVLDKAFAAHPERFVTGQPTPPLIPTEVWINKPTQQTDSRSAPAPSLISELEPLRHTEQMG